MPQARSKGRIWEENILTDPCLRLRLTLRRDESRRGGHIREISVSTNPASMKEPGPKPFRVAVVASAITGTVSRGLIRVTGDQKGETDP